VTQAIRVVQKHPEDTDSLKLLVEAVMMLGSLPELPTRDRFESPVPENIDVDPDDEVILDPGRIERPCDTRRAALKLVTFP